MVGAGVEVWEVRGQIIRVEWAEFQIIWSQKKIGNPPTNNFPDVVHLQLVSVLLLSPRNPRSHFDERPKGARRKMIEIDVSKILCGAVWCHLVKTRCHRMDVA